MLDDELLNLCIVTGSLDRTDVMLPVLGKRYNY